ncbi:MAG: BrnT family toxin [Terriglobales bacterium]
MRFTWDPEKNRINQRKHGISFESVVPMFFDERSIPVEDREVEGESRKWLLGWSHSLAVLVVVYVDREDDDEEIIRIISARKATRSERREYEAALRSRGEP